MGERLTFEVAGKVQPKERPRFGNGRTYTKTATVRYEQLVGRAAGDAWGLRKPTTAPVEVAITVYRARPKKPGPTHEARAGSEATSGHKWCTTTPDADNIAKAVLDGCNRVVWKDDSQVVRLVVAKLWCRGGEAARVVVAVGVM